MDQDSSPTRAQQLWIYSLEGLYNRPELAPSDRKRAERIVSSNEISMSKKEEFAIVANYLLQERGRWQALQTIYRNYIDQLNAGGQLDEWYFVGMAEFAEIQRLLRNEEFDTALLRGSSFVEHFLQDDVDWLRGAPAEYSRDDEPSFAKLINFSRKAGFIDDLDQKLLHYIREVRNTSAHHAWLKSGLDPKLARVAARTLLFEIQRLLAEKADSEGIPIPDFDIRRERAKSFVATIEDDYQWTYNAHQKRWFQP